jgi:predicted lipoprotein
MTKEQLEELSAAETELRGALAEVAVMTGPRGQAGPGLTGAEIRPTRERIQHAADRLRKVEEATV